MASHKTLASICVAPDTPLSEVLTRQCGQPEAGIPAGIALVVNDQGVLVGVITDGDMRRALLRAGRLDQPACSAMNADPIIFPMAASYREILDRLPDELGRRHRRSNRFLGKIVLTDPAGRPQRVLNYDQLWEQRVATHRHLVVVGMGYVGLTLALVLAGEGFTVTGVDVDAAKIEALNRGESHVREPGINELLRARVGRNLFVETQVPAHGDVFIIAVGTPVARGTPGAPIPTPQLDGLVAAVRQVGAKLAPGNLVVLRSTVPIGCTRGVVLPLLEETSGLTAGVDFHLAFAPERTAEGKALEELRSLPQLIGGLNQDSVEATVALFRELAPVTVRMESLEAAEMAKLINNCFRDHVFAFANEMAQVAARFNLDVVEVIRGANRGYARDPVPLPSPGVGGPCLTKDPYILAAARADDEHPRALSVLGRAVNESMHAFVVETVLTQLRALGKDPGAARVLVCGLAFKGDPETGDLRDSSGVAVARSLQARVGSLVGYDPVASAAELQSFGIEPVRLPDGFAGTDAVLFLNNHKSFLALDLFAMVAAMNAPTLVFDGWHLFHADDVLAAGAEAYVGLGMVRRAGDQEGRSWG